MDTGQRGIDMSIFLLGCLAGLLIVSGLYFFCVLLCESSEAEDE